MRSRLILLLVCFVLSGCSSESIFSKSNGDFKVAISSASSIECTDTVLTNSVSCIFPIEISSIADSPKSLSGNFFAVVDGKIFLADTTYGGINSISETWNPAESKSGVVPFTVPRGSNISLIFLAPEDSSTKADALLSLSVNVKAVDGLAPDIQQSSAYLSEVEGIASRLTKSSGYPWLGEVGESGFATLFTTSESGPTCLFLVVSVSELTKDGPSVYEDLQSGLGIESWENDRNCTTALDSTPEIKKINKTID